MNCKSVKYHANSVNGREGCHRKPVDEKEKQYKTAVVNNPIYIWGIFNSISDTVRERYVQTSQNNAEAAKIHSGQ